MKSNFTITGSRALALLMAPVAILAPAPSLLAQSDEDDRYMGESPERYAQVKMVEGDVIIRKGDGDESLERGTPVGEGDVVESRGRGILQLGDGSRILFAPGTRFQVSALFADRDGDRQVLLRLDYGRLRVNVGWDSEARIRVDTPVGAGTLQDGDTASFEVDRDQIAQVRVFRGRITFANNFSRAKLEAGERLTVYGSRDGLDRVRNFNAYEGDSFDRWCDDNGRPRKSASWDRVPREIRYYADDLDDNGEWIYVDEFGSYCWRPRRVSEDWRPYWRGRWAAYPGGMTWVSSEPWGYVTSHYGRWGWQARIGWYWIPGVYYSPAWVAWNTQEDYFGWAPLDHWNSPCAWNYGPWGGGFCWNIVQINYVSTPHIHHHIHSHHSVIKKFGVGIGISISDRPSRPRESGWQRTPLIVTRREFGNAREMRRVISERPVMQERIQRYERESRQSTGREILRMSPRPGGDRPSMERPGRMETERPSRPAAPFEDRSRLSRPIFRTEGRPQREPDAPRPGREGRRPDLAPEQGRPDFGRPDAGRHEIERPAPPVEHGRPNWSRPREMEGRPGRSPEGTRIPAPFIPPAEDPEMVKKRLLLQQQQSESQRPGRRETPNAERPSAEEPGRSMERQRRP